MNIFFLDEDYKLAAKYHVNRHVIKMQVESAQMLSTASFISRNRPEDWMFYKPTHENHPCNVWARKSLDNWLWLRNLAYELQNEWRYRWNHTKNHKSILMLDNLPEPLIPSIGLTELPQAVDENCKSDNPIDAYRKYYITSKTKLHDWGIRGKPEWI